MFPKFPIRNQTTSRNSSLRSQPVTQENPTSLLHVKPCCVADIIQSQCSYVRKKTELSLPTSPFVTSLSHSPLSHPTHSFDLCSVFTALPPTPTRVCACALRLQRQVTKLQQLQGYIMRTLMEFHFSFLMEYFHLSAVNGRYFHLVQFSVSQLVLVDSVFDHEISETFGVRENSSHNTHRKIFIIVTGRCQMQATQDFLCGNRRQLNQFKT